MIDHNEEDRKDNDDDDDDTAIYCNINDHDNGENPEQCTHNHNKEK